MTRLVRVPKAWPLDAYQLRWGNHVCAQLGNGLRSRLERDRLSLSVSLSHPLLPHRRIYTILIHSPRKKKKKKSGKEKRKLSEIDPLCPERARICCSCSGGANLGKIRSTVNPDPNKRGRVRRKNAARPWWKGRALPKGKKILTGDASWEGIGEVGGNARTGRAGRRYFRSNGNNLTTVIGNKWLIE